MSYSPSLLKGKSDKATIKDADRMLINVAELKDAFNLDSDKDVRDFVTKQMKDISWRGEMRLSQNGDYIVAYRNPKFSFNA